MIKSIWDTNVPKVTEGMVEQEMQKYCKEMANYFLEHKLFPKHNGN